MRPVGKSRDCAVRDLYFVPKSVGNVRVSDSDVRPSASGSLLGVWRTFPRNSRVHEERVLWSDL